ncbi:MAG: hypothetical protein WD273_10250 [Trueperaceae bacterium]
MGRTVGREAGDWGRTIEAIFEWLANNTGLLSNLLTLATLLVWLVWLQLMYNDYRRRRQPRMLIHQTQGFGPNSHCLLVNLSQDIIHVECVRAAGVGEDGESSLALGREVELPEDHELGQVELENAIRQGPLRQGDMMRLGSFEQILENIAGQSPLEGEKWLGPTALGGVQTVEIRVVAVYGRSDRSVGARRRFRLESRDKLLRVRPVDTYTDQLYTRSGRRLAEKWLEQCLDD